MVFKTEDPVYPAVYPFHCGALVIDLFPFGAWPRNRSEYPPIFMQGDPHSTFDWAGIFASAFHTIVFGRAEVLQGIPILL